MKINIGNIQIKNKINIGDIKLGIKKVYPPLENLEATPTGEKQVFNHPNSYGYDEVVVNAVESDELTVTPKAETQVKEGLFNKVTVAGDENLIADNIKEGTSIFGVEGTAKTTNAKITSGYYLFYEGYRTDYVNELLSLCEGLTNCYGMFYNCRNLTELNVSNFDTSNVTDMGYMFYNCRNLTELNVSNFDTSNVTNAQSMFRNCNRLTELDLSSFDMSKIISIGDIFVGTTGLINLKSFKNLGKGFTDKKSNYVLYQLKLSDNTSLTKESLLDVITNGLYDLNLTYDVANGGTLYRQSLVLGSTNLAKLTADEIAIATNKGWDVT